MYCMLYSSEPLWTGEAGIAMLQLFLQAVFACLPAAAAFRKKQTGLGAACLALGILGEIFWIPWIVAVVLVSGKIPFRERRDGLQLRTAGRIYGLFVAAYGIILLLVGMSAFGDVAGSDFREFYLPTILNGVVGGGFLLLVGGLTIACSFARYRGFWGWYMALPFLLLVGTGQIGRYAGFLRYIGYLFLVGGGIFFWWGVFQSVDRESRAEARKAFEKSGPQPGERRPAQGKMRCLGGQYAGAEFPFKDGETLCLGSDPNLAHLVFSTEETGPLHLEITYQKQEGVYLLAHPAQCQVFLRGQGWLTREVLTVPAGSRVGFGSPVQEFLLL